MRALLSLAFWFALCAHTRSDYVDHPAKDKQLWIWNLMVADNSSNHYMNPISTALKVADPNYLRYMEQNDNDWYENTKFGPKLACTHTKATHGIGAHASAHFEWQPNEYQGMFQKADHCIVRMAAAAEPGGFAMTSYGPNMAVKCFRDGVKSANMQFIWQLDGYAVMPKGEEKSCSYFETPISNHCPDRDDISFILKNGVLDKFNKVDARSMLLGVSQMSDFFQNGTKTPPASPTNPSFPFALLLAPAPGLNSIRCDGDNPISQLLNLKEAGLSGPGKTLYEVFAVRDPSDDPSKDDIKHIGTLKLDSHFTTSKYGDTELFFQHRFFASEVDQLDDKRALSWNQYTYDRDFYKIEGANKYWPLLPQEVTSYMPPPTQRQDDLVV